MRIQHNIMAMNAYRNYNTNTSALSKNLEKLSSGYKINRAGDDAAGLAISEKMRAQITGLNAAQKNVKDGISLVKTAEGAMQEIQDMLNRMDYLATQSANGTYDDTVDRANLQKEVDALKSEIDRIAESANFNGIKLLDGKTGLNGIEITDAAAVAAKPAGDIAFGSDAFITASASGVHGVHVSPAVTATAGEFVIDLAGIMGDASKVTLATGDTITINVGTKAITYTATAAASYASAGALANAIVTAFNKTVATAGAAATNAALSLGAIGSMAFTAAATDTTKIKFTFAGTVETATVATAAGGTTGGVPNTDTINKVANTSIQASDAEKFNNFINGSNLKVSATIVSKNQTKSMELHGVQGIKNSVPDDGNDRAGITVDFSKVSGLYAEGNKLTIDGTEYTISMEKAPATKATNTIYLGDVNVAANATDGAKAAAYAAEMVKQLTTKGATTARFNLTEVGAGKLHIDQKATDTDKFTEKTLKELFSAKQTNAEAAKGKGVTIDFANAKAGAKLVIGEGSTAKTFTLVEGAAVASKGEISLSNAPEELKAALGTTAYAYDPIATGAKSITIRTKDTNATAKAPVVGNTGLTLQIGDTSDSYNQLQVKTGDLHTAALGIANLDIKNPTSAAAAIQTIKDAINNVSSIRGDLGAVQNRLEHTANNLSVMAENIQDAESTIRDTDVAEEMMAYTKNNILIQSAQAMLAQANAVPQGVLQLLG